jgi:hypothetical protein
MRIAVNIRRFMAERRRLIDLVAEQHADLARLRAALERLRGRSFLGLTPTHGTASAVISRRDLYGLMGFRSLSKSLGKVYCALLSLRGRGDGGRQLDRG